MFAEVKSDHRHVEPPFMLLDCSDSRFVPYNKLLIFLRPSYICLIPFLKGWRTSHFFRRTRHTVHHRKYCKSVPRTRPQLVRSQSFPSHSALDQSGRMSVLSYAIDFLKVKHVIVMGHYGCGGVAAAITPVAPPPMSSKGPVSNPVEDWVQPIREIYMTSQR